MDWVWVAAAYLLGAVPFSQIVAQWRRPGVDLRAVGTGTVSGTGLYRVAGFWPLVLGGGLDVAKGAVAATFARGEARLGVLVAAAVVVGHCWSVFLRGAGGRGVSPALGALAVLAWPGTVVLLTGLALGRLAGQTGLGVFVADVATIAVLAATRGASGAALGAAVVAPMLLKRVLGNWLPAPNVLTYVWRLLYDADPPATTSGQIGTDTLTAIVRLVAARLEQHRDELNRMNVYPVPDGDTGDNVVSTVGTVVEHAAHARGWAALTEAVARGGLLGGRGSSGVILGQALGAFAKSLREDCGAEGLAAALEASATSARAAVADPVEGTILTVADDAAREARTAAASGGTLADVARAAATEGRESLARTPDLLPALARAGVVDAGGLAYVLFLDAVTEAVAGVQGRPIEPATRTDGTRPRVPEEPSVRYEVLCLLEADADRISILRQRWLSLGDTVAIAGGERTWRCHVHTDDIAGAIDAAGEAGEVLDVEITDLAEQVVENGVRTHGAPGGAVSVVAVAEGDGLVAAYVEAGADRVVLGGITTKPSTDELLRVLDGYDRPVALLAGDRDVVPAARRAVELSSVPASLVATDMVGGLMALTAVGPTLDGDAAMAVARLDAVCRGVRTARIQRAVRAARTELGEVHAGEWLARGDGGLVAIGATAEEALQDAVASIVAPETTAGLLAVDLEATPDGDAEGDVATRLRAQHPHVRWTVLRTNRRLCAYGVAVR